MFKTVKLFLGTTALPQLAGLPYGGMLRQLLQGIQVEKLIMGPITHDCRSHKRVVNFQGWLSSDPEPTVCANCLYPDKYDLCKQACVGSKVYHSNLSQYSLSQYIDGDDGL